ncbi:hypothetical protein FRC02_010214 [Tulasnella sp. 418]|nr:hypothetical protein FRC02_010214 [Tulasnella sp. 418]
MADLPDLHNYGSLYQYLTAMSTPEPSPATHATITLIQAIARNACRTKRNIQTLCLIARRACDVCDTVNERLNQAVQQMDWDIMDECGETIERLESLLADILIMSQNEMEATPETSLNSWTRNRGGLVETLDTLCNTFYDPPSEAWNQDLATYRRYDDLAWLDQVVTSIAENDDVDGRHSAIVSVVKDINSALKRASSDKSKDDTKNIDDVIKFSTQCIMKLCSVTRKGVSDGNSSDTDEEDPQGQDQTKDILEDLLGQIERGSPEPQHLEQRLSKLEASTVYGIDATSRPIRGKEKVMFKSETIPEPASNIDASRAIKLPEVNPGYLVFQRSEESDKTYIRDLKPKGDNREYAFPLSTRILAVNETRTMVAFYTDDDNRNYVKLSSIPFDANSPSCEIEVEEKVVHIFWLQPNLVGFLSESGGFYTSDVSSKDGDYVLEPAQLLFQLPTGAVIKRDRLNISMASTEDEVEWLAFNTVVNDGPIVKAQVYVWSQKSLQGTLLDGIGTLTQMNIDDKPRNLLIMTSRKASSQSGRIPISLVVYDLDHTKAYSVDLKTVINFDGSPLRLV